MSAAIAVAALIGLAAVCALSGAGRHRALNRVTAIPTAPTRVPTGVPTGAPTRAPRDGLRLAPHTTTRFTRGPRRWLTRRDKPAEAARWIATIRRLAALLQAGRPPETVFGALSDGDGSDPTQRLIHWLAARVHAAAAVGVPVSVSLARVAHGDVAVGDRQLERWARSVCVQLSAAWEISERSGASLAATLSALADSVESQLDAQAARDSALAGPQATVRVLAWLPVLALGLGMLMGTDPISTLVTTTWGRLAFIAGAVLTVAGRVWTRQLLRHAQAQDGS